MKPSHYSIICWLGLVVAFCNYAQAEEQPNPYQSIVDRNPFGLKPPPAPPSAESLAPPPAPLAKVVLTGITSMFGPSSKRALFEIEDQEPGKGKSVKRPILREGERDGPVEVISIDVEKNMVRIRNGPVETNLTFEIPKAGPTTPGAGVPGGLPVPLQARVPTLTGGAIPLVPGAGVSSPSAGPMIIGRDGSGSGRGVSIYGGNPAAVTPSPAPVTPPAPGINPAGTTPNLPVRSFYRPTMVPPVPK